MPRRTAASSILTRMMMMLLETRLEVQPTLPVLLVRCCQTRIDGLVGSKHLARIFKAIPIGGKQVTCRAKQPRRRAEIGQVV